MFKFFWVSKFLCIVLCLVSTAFFTLFERKIMGLGHYRKGPNKIAVMGLFQPFSDVIKLMSKNESFLKMSSMMLFFLSPLLSLLVALCMWLFIYYWGSSLTTKFAFLFVLLLSSLNVFFILFTGWVSGSFYSMLGAYRSTAQMISYEGLLFILVVCMFWVSSQMSLKKLFTVNKNCALLLSLALFCLFWLISVMAETSRTPFDFSEGESELVSGFNTEFGAGLFSLIFLAEYMNILFFMFITSYMAMGMSLAALGVASVALYSVVMIRCSYPRFRYDHLMLWSWKNLMVVVTPVVIFMYFFNNF